jgi:hypothetical protein
MARRSTDCCPIGRSALTHVSIRAASVGTIKSHKRESDLYMPRSPHVGEREFRLVHLKMPVSEITIRVAGYSVAKGDVELGFVFSYKGR